MTLLSPNFISLRTRLKNSNKKELTIQGFLFLASFVAIIVVFLVIVFLIRQAYPLYLHTSVADFLFGLKWLPDATNPSFGAAPIILGTIFVTIGAMVIALPLGLGCAIFIAFIAPPKIRVFMKSAVELLSGVPSVIFGFFGLQIIVPWIRNTFDTAGPSFFAASLIVGLIALPTIVTVMEDAMTSAGRDLWEASVGLGATRWETISKVIIPSAISGIGAGIMLGVGRAMGETMAVLMVAGNSNIIPLTVFDLFRPISTITGTLGLEMGESSNGTTHQFALYSLAVLLMVMVMAINLISSYFISRLKNRMQGETKKRAIRMPVRPRRVTKWILWMVIAILLLDFIAANSTIFIAFIVLSIVIGAVVLFHFLPRQAVQYIAFGLAIGAFALVMFFLGYVLYDVISKGARVVTFQFIFSMPTYGGSKGGVFASLVGTLELVGGALLVAAPIGICAAIYLNEYSRETWLKKIIRIGIDNLNGLPSIIFGLFGFTLLVITFKFGISLLAGQITLGFMILPTIIRTTEESLKAIPLSLREASLALGSTKWQTISQVVLPASAPGTLTGIILSIGRAAGETAPLLFTACAFSRFLPQSELDTVQAMSWQIYLLTQAYPNAIMQAYGVAFVLLVLVLIMYSIAIIVRYYYKNKFKL
ncbi:MAG TPA: phosphate ABC transporter permease PstA [Candidatus Lokiarchaeia archaeon]|nr:phosphate ABC transporter permease PstA [Candidatus Lokiarchaeia archaeon]